MSCAIFFKNIPQLFINFTHSFVAIELLTFCKNAEKKTILLLERALTILAKEIIFPMKIGVYQKHYFQHSSKHISSQFRFLTFSIGEGYF